MISFNKTLVLGIVASIFVVSDAVDLHLRASNVRRLRKTTHDSLELASLFDSEPDYEQLFGSSLLEQTDDALKARNEAVRSVLLAQMQSFSLVPTMRPSDAPSDIPSTAPSVQVPEVPSDVPSTAPFSVIPTVQVSELPSDVPSIIPSVQVSPAPTVQVSEVPSTIPTIQVSEFPSDLPSVLPTQKATIPSATVIPTSFPSDTPSDVPSIQPTVQITEKPADVPSFIPSVRVTEYPSDVPSFIPTLRVTDSPSDVPSDIPSFLPTEQVTTELPSLALSDVPSQPPTEFPTYGVLPTPLTLYPTLTVSDLPTGFLSDVPSALNYPDTFVPLSDCGTSEETRALNILSMLDIYTTTPSVIRNITTPQGKATNWLINQDALHICPEDTSCQLLQRWALAVLYYSTSGYAWTSCNAMGSGDCGSVAPFDQSESSFLAATSECDWAGVTCEDGCVTKIQFVKNNLAGSIPTEVGLLSNLAYLRLEHGALAGTIPTELAMLSGLRFLDIDFNDLTGPLPNELFSLSKLAHFDVNDNHLSGNIEGLGMLSSLRFVQIHDNAFTGTVPEALGQNTDLHTFTLIGTDISGSMPQAVCDLVNNGTLTSLNADCRSAGPYAAPAVSCPCCTECRVGA